MFAFLVMIFLLGAVFSVENSELVSPLFFGISLTSLSLGLWMTISLFTGALIGLLMSILPVYFGRYSLIAKEKKIQRLEKELSVLRLAAVKE